MTTLGEVVDIKHGFAFEGRFFTDYPKENVLLTPGNFAIGGGYKGDRLKYYDGPVPEEFVLAVGDVIVTMTDLSKRSDTLGYPAIVPAASDLRFLHNQRLGKAVIKDERSLDKRFLYYLLCTRDYRHEVVAGASGTTVKHTSPTRIGAFRFQLPPIFVQRQIAHILGTLDDKIELNRKMNETLEQMARALYKSWFVDFEPFRDKGMVDSPLGKIPKGWKVESVYVAAEVVYGAPFSSAKFNTDGVGKPLVRIRDLVSEMPEVSTAEEHPKGYLVKPGDIVVGMDGEFRVHLWGGEESWLNQRVCVFRPKVGFPSPFVFHSIVGPLADVEASETATTVIHLGKNDIDRFQIILPMESVLTEFGYLTEPLFQRIVLNKQESRALAAIRDALLPKLMSGEIGVNEAETLTRDSL